MASKLNFVRQQGFLDASPELCNQLYPALMWQPRVIGLLFLVGLAFQAAPFFLALGALLWWNAILPALNPFDALYNRLLAKPQGVAQLPPAPAPRRFAQAEAGTVILTTGLALLSKLNLLAYSLEGLILASLMALVFARFCQGSYLFWLFTGRSAVANTNAPNASVPENFQSIAIETRPGHFGARQSQYRFISASLRDLRGFCVKKLARSDRAATVDLPVGNRDRNVGSGR